MRPIKSRIIYTVLQNLNVVVAAEKTRKNDSNVAFPIHEQCMDGRYGKYNLREFNEQTEQQLHLRVLWDNIRFRHR